MIHRTSAAPTDSHCRNPLDKIFLEKFLKRIDRSGYDPFLFFDWRYNPDGTLRAEFELNQARFQKATILLAGADFGCGSSREHAVWAMNDFGFRAVIAPSFGQQFYVNSFKNGLLSIRLDENRVGELFERTESNTGYTLKIDLVSQTIQDDSGLEFHFEIDPFLRESLLNGWNEIALTLLQEEKIVQYEKSHKSYGMSTLH